MGCMPSRLDCTQQLAIMCTESPVGPWPAGTACTPMWPDYQEMCRSSDQLTGLHKLAERQQMDICARAVCSQLDNRGGDHVVLQWSGAVMRCHLVSKDAGGASAAEQKGRPWACCPSPAVLAYWWASRLRIQAG